MSTKEEEEKRRKWSNKVGMGTSNEYANWLFLNRMRLAKSISYISADRSSGIVWEE